MVGRHRDWHPSALSHLRQSEQLGVRRLDSWRPADAGHGGILLHHGESVAVDRLLHHAHVIITEGQSNRLTEALDGRGVAPLEAPRASRLVDRSRSKPTVVAWTVERVQGRLRRKRPAAAILDGRSSKTNS